MATAVPRFTSLLFVPPPKSPPFFPNSKPSTPSLPIHQLTRRVERISLESPRFWRLSASPADELPSETAQIVASTDDSGSATIVSALLFTAFISLALLTIGVIYLAVQDFLQKREREKYEKEEAAKKKKGGKKAKVRARAGPRGFGQKIEEDED